VYSTSDDRGCNSGAGSSREDMDASFVFEDVTGHVEVRRDALPVPLRTALLGGRGGQEHRCGSDPADVPEVGGGCRVHRGERAEVSVGILAEQVRVCGVDVGQLEKQRERVRVECLEALTDALPGFGMGVPLIASQLFVTRLGFMFRPRRHGSVLRNPRCRTSPGARPRWRGGPT